MALKSSVESLTQLLLVQELSEYRVAESCSGSREERLVNGTEGS